MLTWMSRLILLDAVSWEFSKSRQSQMVIITVLVLADSRSSRKLVLEYCADLQGVGLVVHLIKAQQFLDNVLECAWSARQKS
jgi:hypothetical protein